MLGHHDAVATVAVRDLNAASRFYGEILGLTPIHTEGEEVITYQGGSSQLIVYRSQYAGTNRATAVTWDVGDELNEIIRTLKGKGVTFEHYDMPDVHLEGDVHVSGSLRVAWFHDPDGNIHSLYSES
jgi:catechol 2,3-dioxygenase-like lactoylglutathione lyase family enzyme